jgi:hypothetical protein
MAKEPVSDDDFYKKYEACERRAAEEFLREQAATGQELRDLISSLIAHRQALGAAELDRLEAESRDLLARLQRVETEKVVEELRCFKDVLTLHRQLVEDTDRAPGRDA